MKRSKTMMGLVALLLAGAFASATNVPQDVYYFENEMLETGCKSITLDIDCSAGEPTCERPTPDGDRQLYEDSTCEQPLQEDAGF